MAKPTISVELQRLGNNGEPEVNELVVRYEEVEAYIDLPIGRGGLRADLLRLAAAITGAVDGGEVFGPASLAEGPEQKPLSKG